MTPDDFVRRLQTEPLPWDSEAAERTFAKIEERTFANIEERPRSAAPSSRWVWLAAAALVCSIVFVATRWLQPTHEARGTNVLGTPTEARSLPDSSVALLSAGAELNLTDYSPQRLALRQQRGSVEYRVTPGLAREFVVVARDVTVTVVGTVFTISLDEQSSSVAVERGEVKVSARGQTTTLRAKQRLVLGRTQPEPRQSGPRPEASRAEAEREPPPVEAQAAPRPSANGGVLSGNSHPLLEQADAARRAGQLPRAIAALERFVKEAPGDARVASSSFTLGRLYRQTGSNLPAATAFRRAYERDASGALAEDARAQEIEALAAAASWDSARRLAHEYLELYPRGRYRARILPLAK